MNKNFSSCIFLLASSFSLLAPAVPVFAQQSNSNSAMVTNEISARVAVESVDLQNRTLTVKDDIGDERTVVVPESVKNLAQIKKGDNIVLRYQEALATRILKPGEGSQIVESSGSSATAPSGAEPGALTQRQTKATIKIKSVDQAKNILTFEGPRGATRTVAVRSPEMQEQLKQLKPGDNVEVVYNEALAVSVEPVRR